MKLLCVGFSVTEEKSGYVSVLSELFGDKVKVSSCAIGGATFSLLPYILPRLLSDNFGSNILFEISTCYRFKNTTQEYLDILEEIEFLCKKYECTPIFVSLYREGVDYSNDLLSLSIEFFSRSRNYHYIDLSRYMLDNNKKKIFLRDGVHTTYEGSRFYGEKIHESIAYLFENGYHAWSEKSFIFLTDLVANSEPRHFSRGGFETSYLSIESGQEITVDIPEDYLLHGLVYLMGPTSGDVFIDCSDTAFTRTIHMFDERCYYTRCAYQFFPVQKTKKISIKQLEGIPNIDLVKGEKNVGPRVGSIAGFLVSKRMKT